MVLYMLLSVLLFLLGTLLPALGFANVSFGEVAVNVTNAIGDISSLMRAVCYVVGLGFGISALIKFKQHKDNPQQIQLSAPVAELTLSICLMFLPTVSNLAGNTMFGRNEAVSASPSGRPTNVNRKPAANVHRPVGITPGAAAPGVVNSPTQPKVSPTEPSPDETLELDYFYHPSILLDDDETASDAS